jgi:hypothetical protein
MKLFYLSIPIIFLFLIGCSSTYKVTDYPSKAKFHEDINSCITNRDVNVVAVDSSFTSFAGSRINDDSLQIVSKIQEKIPLKEVKDIKGIKYYGSAYQGPSASIWLKSGEELRTENVKILPDSTIQFTNIANGYIPIDKVKEISYKTGWPGALTGIPIGLGGGAIIGGILGSAGVIFHINSGGMKDTFDKGQSAFVGMVSGGFIGIVTGFIVGYITGWDNIYQINH